jgi:transposase-like protein
MSSSRRRFSPEQKAQIVRRHLANNESISSLAEELGLQRSQIHLWVNTLLAQADKAFEWSSGSTRADKATAQRKITAYIDRHNNFRLHSAIGDITPADKLLGLEPVICQECDRKLEEASRRRQMARLQGPCPTEVAGQLFTGDNLTRLGQRIRLCRGATGTPSQGPRPKPGRSHDCPASSASGLAPMRHTFAARCRDFLTGCLTVTFTNATPTKFVFPLSQHNSANDDPHHLIGEMSRKRT